MNSVFFVTTAFLCFILEVYCASTNVKFDLVFENMTDCSNPQPPYTDKPLVTFEMNVQKINGKTFLSGKNRVLEEVPFLNYTVITYSISASGEREQLLKVGQRNCRSFVAQTFLLFGRFRYNKSNCHLLKGTTVFKDLDLDKVAHSVPNWHSEGIVVHQVNLVAGKRTVFCREAFVSVKAIK